ncbi:MAG: HRDC domain-containing protein, partial [Planctomycetales bacterium]
KADRIAFDTYFVSEDTYRPELCLIQLAIDGHAAAIDPLAIRDLSRFWDLFVNGDHETIMHAGREELRFCLAATGKCPRRIVDVQIAAGFIGLEYPAGYGTLIQKILGVQMKKSETRTDWRKRPLSAAQLDYALDDVVHLLPLRDKLFQRLGELNRVEWLSEELATWLESIRGLETRERWRNVSGGGGLRGKSLVVLRELWRWREAEAQRRNQPARRILRDDLLVELARRRVTDPDRIHSLRGMERPKFKKMIPELIQAIQLGLDTPEEDYPRYVRRDTPPRLTMVGQFLTSALSSICREANMAPSLAGNPSDVRELIVHQLGNGDLGDREPPKLSQGWRAELVGNLLTDLLTGKVTIRIRDPQSENPLEFKPFA